MLQVADYRAVGLKLLVRLRCSCGGKQVVKSQEGAEEIYTCAQCNAQTRLSALKNEATIYWRGLIWEIEGATSGDSDALHPVAVHYSAQLSPRLHRYARPYCTLNGYCTELGPSELVFQAADFQPVYAKGINTDQRFATVDLIEPAEDLPRRLYGLILQVQYRDEDLPKATLRVCFQEMPATEMQMIGDHVRRLAG
jgi:hypothetical protein